MEESSPLSPLAPRRRFQSPCRVPIEFRRYQTFSRRRSIHRSRLYCLRFFGGRTAEGSRREIRSFDENVSPFRSSPREGPSPHPWLRRSNGRFDKRRLQGPSGKCKSSSWISLWGQLCVARALPRHPHRARLHDEPGVILPYTRRQEAERRRRPSSARRIGSAPDDPIKNEPRRGFPLFVISHLTIICFNYFLIMVNSRGA